ncbi:MAG TPA: L-histidine N(alpha)-methyltransferase, partial [Nannocystaceae bacterium]|nr:L-histidine N(alpha)-methyltransferase [Nannocystaceae bacterium]
EGSMRTYDTSRSSARTRMPTPLPREQGNDVLADVLRGLAKPRKTLPTALLYDARGSELFEQICELPEYYPTRTELAIMRAHVGEIAEAIGSDATLFEYGSGSSVKTRLLLAALHEPRAYLPVDISREHLLATAEQLRAEFPALHVEPICADFTRPLELPTTLGRGRRVGYFPGSTIGNFEAPAAIELLRQLARLAGREGRVLVGADLRKPASVLEPAYDDAAGVTAEFNLNLLVRINRELRGDFDPSRFEHRAYWDDEHGRIVMTLVSTCAQVVTVAGRSFAFAEGEAVRTEYSHKYTLESFAELAQRAGLRVERVWTDPQQWFSVQLLRR